MPSLYETMRARLAAIEEKKREKQKRNQGHPWCWLKPMDRRDIGYHGPRIRRAILSTLTTEWMEWGDLLHHLCARDPFCNHPLRIAHVLSFLEDHFRIETQEIYDWPRHPKEPYPSLEQRMSRPPGKSLGSHNAYRLMTLPRQTVIHALEASAQGMSTHEIASTLGIRWDFAFQLSLKFRYHDCPADQLQRLIHLATRKIP